MNDIITKYIQVNANIIPSDTIDHTNALKAMSMIVSHFIVESIYAKTKYK